MASNIVVSMTNFCNNRCKFCYMSKFLIDKIEENIDYDKFYNNTIYLLKKVNDKVSLRVYGGELFADEFSDDHINSVYNYIDKVEKGKKMFLWTAAAGLFFLAISFSFATKTDYSRLNKQWNRGYIVERFGIYLYQFNDIFQTIKPRISSMFGYEEAYDLFNNIFFTNKIK